MTGKERMLAMLDGRPVDHLPLMPITMMFAADQIGGLLWPVRRGPPRAGRGPDARRRGLRLRLRLLHLRSGPRGGRLRGRSRVLRRPAAGHRRGVTPCWPTRTAGSPQDARPAGRRPDARPGARVRLAQTAGRGRELIEGWVEGPCAEAADLRGINTADARLLRRPGFVRDLFDFVVEMELRFAAAQVEAGADLIGVGDAAASLVGPQNLRGVRLALREEAGRRPCTRRARGSACTSAATLGRILDGMGPLGCDMVDLDFMVPMAEARAAMGPEPGAARQPRPGADRARRHARVDHRALAQCHRRPPVRATSSAPAARSPATRPRRTCKP